MMSHLVVLYLLLFICSCNSQGRSQNQTSQRPHIIIIMADDLGWNDVSFHGSSQILTPNLDALAASGVVLHQHYVQPLCTPSRAAFLTGRYPLHMGMQHSVILEPEPRGLGLQYLLLPQLLQRLGYSTHAVGKWHLGYHTTQHTPTYRGFSSHYGYWNGFQDYYDHTVTATFDPSMSGYDMRRDLDVDWSARGQYSTRLFTREALQVLKTHGTRSRDVPLMLYLAHLAPHAANMRDPFQAPDDLLTQYTHIKDPERRVYAGMVSALDESVGAILQGLREARMLNNTLLLFLSDNGAPTNGIHANRGSNYPLRGQKESPWEGGSRGVGVLWSPLLGAPRVSRQLMHVSDWLPTLWSAAGGAQQDLPEKLDGYDMWAALRDNTPSPRDNLVINLDPLVPYVAVRQGKWKYVNGTTAGGKYDEWYGETDNTRPYDVTQVLTCAAAHALAGHTAEKQLQEKKRGSGYSVHPLTEEDVLRVRTETSISCSPPGNVKCSPLESPCLFDIEADPCEHNNLAAVQPMVLQELQQMVTKYSLSAVAPANLPADPAANPALHGGVWTSWQDTQVQVRNAFDVFSPSANIAFAVFCAVCCLALVVVGVASARKRGYCRSEPRGGAPIRLAPVQVGTGTRTGQVARTVEMFEIREQAKSRSI